MHDQRVFAGLGRLLVKVAVAGASLGEGQGLVALRAEPCVLPFYAKFGGTVGYTAEAILSQLYKTATVHRARPAPDP